MEVELATIENDCHICIAKLLDLDISPSNKASFDLQDWRQRLEEAAKGIEFCGGYLFVFSRDTPTPHHQLRCRKLIDHIDTLANLIIALPAQLVGVHYTKAVRDAAMATLIALEKLPSLNRQMRASSQAPPSFQWNQTLRLRDLPENCMIHLQLNWERWSCRLRETYEHFKIVVKVESLVSCVGDMNQSPKTLNNSEKATIKECLDLIKIVRSLFRKVRVRCLGRLDAEDTNDIPVADEIFQFGEQIVFSVDELSKAMLRPDWVSGICEIAREITILAIELAGITEERASENHRHWFSCYGTNLDALLLPLMERNPVRKMSTPIWKRPFVFCFSIGLVAGIGMEVLYQKSGYYKAIEAELRNKERKSQLKHQSE